MSQQCIGITKGPGETAHEFTFVTPDPDRRIRNGEFVYYQATVDSGLHQILGRVTGRLPLRLYPDSFLADPDISPSEVAGMLGFHEQQHELFEISVQVMGYFDTLLGDFINPRVPPESGSPIYICEDHMLAEVLSKKKPEDIGSAHIGSLLSRTPQAVPICLDVRSFTSTHMAIIAGTGAGKSYLASVIIEELMKPYNRACILVVDPHGEYDTLQDMMGIADFDSETGYRPDVRIVRPEQIRVQISSLTLGDFRYLLSNLSEKMHFHLGQTYRAIQRKYSGNKWTLNDFMVQLRQGERDQPVTDPDDDQDMDPTIGALIWRLGNLFNNSHIFHDYENMELTTLFRPGQCTVLQLNEIDRREQQIIVATLLRRLNQARMDTEKGLATEDSSDNYLPYPAFVLIEEAHNYAPANADVVTTGILQTILSEGRKFGVSIGLISQRPGKLDSDVLSQCMTQCTMRIVNPVDQARIAESVESMGRDLLNELPALSKGQVIITGNAVNTPLLCRVRTRLTRHGAEDPDAPARWQAYFDDSSQAQRKRDEAFPVQEKRKSRLYK